MKRLFLRLSVTCALAAMIISACAPAKSPLRANGFSHIRIVGRADTRDVRGPLLAWPGTTITAVVTPLPSGRIDARFDEREGSFGTSRYAVFVDGRETPRVIALHASDQTVNVAENLTLEPHRIDLVKRTEASAGTTLFLGFPGSALGELPPPKTKKIEIVGDSNTCAYGVDGEGPSCHFTADTENFLHGYAWDLGKRFNADVTAIAYSGKGVVQNYAREDPLTLGKLYSRSNPMDATSTIDPADFPADAVIVLAGGNDYAQPTIGKNDKPADDAFVFAYYTLLLQVRRAHPQAVLVCVITPSVEDNFPPEYFARSSLTGNILTAITMTQDSEIRIVAPREADKTELTGCDYHPSPLLQARIALAIETELRPLF